MIKRILSKIMPSTLKKELKNFKILAIDYGQYRTVKQWSCVDRYNKEIPWYTYPSIEYFNNIDFSKKIIFEFGSGNSSIYWGKKAKRVISIEDDKDWFDNIVKKKGANQEIVLKTETDEYEKSIIDYDEKFDVIIIDGKRRVECSKIIKDYLNISSEDGYMVVLDNSDWYKGVSEYLRNELDLIEIDFHGFGPINSYTWTTSIFISRNFRFKPIDNIQPNNSVSAVHHSGGKGD